MEIFATGRELVPRSDEGYCILTSALKEVLLLEKVESFGGFPGIQKNICRVKERGEQAYARYYDSRG